MTVTARRKGAQGGWFHWTTSDEAPHFVIDVPKETVADDVVAAVRANRRHVRHPKRALLFPLLTEAGKS